MTTQASPEWTIRCGAATAATYANDAAAAAACDDKQAIIDALLKVIDIATFTLKFAIEGKVPNHE